MLALSTVNTFAYFLANMEDYQLGKKEDSSTIFIFFTLKVIIFIMIHSLVQVNSFLKISYVLHF